MGKGKAVSFIQNRISTLALLPSPRAAIAMPSELDSTRVVETVEPQNFPPLPPGVSFQDIDSETGSEDGGDEEDWDAILAACTSSLLARITRRILTRACSRRSRGCLHARGSGRDDLVP
jgi:hypothetical protein